MAEVVIPSEVPVDEPPDRHQLNSLIAEHLPALQTRAKELCRSHCDPDDLVQQALERAVRTKSPVADLARLRPWLLTILTNTFLDTIRKLRRQPPHIELVVDVPIPDPTERKRWERIGADDLRRAIDQLPADLREPYRMFALEKRDYKEISKALRISPSAVGSRIHRARRQLRVQLEGLVVGCEGGER